MSIAGLGLGLGLGAYIGGPVLASIMLVLAAVVTWIVSGSNGFQRNVDQSIRTHRRLKLRLDREQRLENAGLQRDSLAELSSLVDDIDRSDGGQLTCRLELDDLLDEYADLTIARHRLLRSVRLSDRGQLDRDLCDARLAAKRAGGGTAALRRRISLIERRIRWADDCAERAARCAEELAAIDQFIRLVNQRAACPVSVPLDHDSLDRRLLDLDEEEAALRVLLAGEPPVEEEILLSEERVQDLEGDERDDDPLEQLASPGGRLVEEHALNAPQA